jgi:hypothetical protein
LKLASCVAQQVLREDWAVSDRLEKGLDIEWLIGRSYRDFFLVLFFTLILDLFLSFFSYSHEVSETLFTSSTPAVARD